MQLSSHPIAANPSPAASLAGAKSASSDNAAPSDDGAFARLLAARQNAPHHDAVKPPADRHVEKTAQPPRAEANDAAPAAPSQAPPAQAARPSAPERAKADGRDTPRSAGDDSASPEAPDATRAAPKEEAGSASHGAAALDPAWADWFGALNRPLPPPAQALGSARAAVDATQAESAAGAGACDHALPPNTLLAAHAEAAQTRAAERKAFGFDAMSSAVSTALDSAGLAATTEHDTSAPRIERLAIADTAAILAAPLLQTTPHTAPPSAVLNVSVPTPATAPEFPAALGVQVSLLARDGVQHAQLHLNPAEMGPISIQIALHGTQAQVDFGADSAQTRQIIESGLPELAAALRDAGLTLTGGGVSQHSKGRSNDEAPADDGSGARARVSGGSGDSSASARSVNLRVPLGHVDLYA